MEFYITFKEFKENYEKDLTEWLNTYPDATEEDFLQFIKEEYIYILPLFMDVSINNKNIKFKRSFNVSKSYKNGYIEEENISGYQYADILRLNFMYYIREVKRCKDIKQKDVRLFLRYYWREVTGSVLSPYNLILEYHEIYKPFFKANEVINDPNIILFDEKKYINFEFSINRIFEFINNRMEELKNPPQRTESLPAPFTTSLEWNAQKNIIGTLFGCLYDIGAITGTKKDLAQGLSTLFPNLSNHSLLDNINRKIKENEGKVLYDIDTEIKIKPFLEHLKEKVNKK